MRIGRRGLTSRSRSLDHPASLPLTSVELGQRPYLRPARWAKPTARLNQPGRLGAYIARGAYSGAIRGVVSMGQAVATFTDLRSPPLIGGVIPLIDVADYL